MTPTSSQNLDRFAGSLSKWDRVLLVPAFGDVENPKLELSLGIRVKVQVQARLVGVD